MGSVYTLFPRSVFRTKRFYMVKEELRDSARKYFSKLMFKIYLLMILGLHEVYNLIKKI